MPKGNGNTDTGGRPRGGVGSSSRYHLRVSLPLNASPVFWAYSAGDTGENPGRRGFENFRSFLDPVTWEKYMKGEKNDVLVQTIKQLRL